MFPYGQTSSGEFLAPLVLTLIISFPGKTHIMRVVRRPWSKWRENLRYRLLPGEGRGGQGAREQEGRQCGAGQVMSADLTLTFIYYFLFRARSHPRLRPRPPINYSEGRAHGIKHTFSIQSLWMSLTPFRSQESQGRWG